MAAPIPLRSDLTADDLRYQAGCRRDANRTRRLLALAEMTGGSCQATPLLIASSSTSWDSCTSSS